MQTFSVKCPACGTINRNLYLEETNGFMECEYCRRVSRTPILKWKKREPKSFPPHVNTAG